MRLLWGDCIEVMAAMDPESVDSVVCDPPYGLEFMGKEWDGSDGFRRSLNAADVGRDSVFGRASAKGPEYRAGHLYEEWTTAWATEALRVLKPGGHCLAFGGTRTYHRLASGIEDAGFEIRDSIDWIYGSGFPKSMNVALAIDKRAGLVGNRGSAINVSGKGSRADIDTSVSARNGKLQPGYKEGRSDEARQWEGWGTALKPAHEPIVVARKPLIGTVAANVLQWGTGVLNIDASRVSGSVVAERGEAWANSGKGLSGAWHGTEYVETKTAGERTSPLGRWPANIILSHAPGCVEACTDDCPVAELDAQSGPRKSGGRLTGNEPSTPAPNDIYGSFGKHTHEPRNDTGGASRFFTCVEGCPVAEMDEQSGKLTSGTGAVKRRSSADQEGNTGAAYGAESRPDGMPMITYGDSGGASRYFSNIDNETPFLYAAKASKSERSAGLERWETINVEASWENEVLEAKLQVDTGTSPPRVIEGFNMTDANAWNMMLFGNSPTDRFPTEIKSITGTKSNSTTTSPTLNFLIHSPTSDFTVDASFETMDGGNPADPVRPSSLSVSFTREATAWPTSVSVVPSSARWQISSAGLGGRSSHPTVKPVAVMKWLVTLVTPPSGLVLDPFMGSGTTGVACAQAAFDFIGIEKLVEYLEIARGRIANAGAIVEEEDWTTTVEAA